MSATLVICLLRRLPLSACLALALGFIWAAPSFAVTEEQAAHLLDEQKIFEANAKIHVSISLVDSQKPHGDKSAVVLVQSPEIKATEAPALKIDGALVAKTLMDADKSIKKVTSRFSADQADMYKEVAVRSLEVGLYGSGQISRDQLLSSLELVEHQGNPAQQTEGGVKEDDLSVVPGQFSEQRLKLLRRIEALKKQGVGVKPFVDRFAQLEEEAKNNQTAQLKGDLQGLEDKVTDQETFLKNRALAEQQRPTSSQQQARPTPLVLIPSGGTQDLMSTFAAAAGQFDPLLKVPQGPRFIERFHVCHELVELRHRGADIKDLTPIVERMNQYALASDDADLVKALDILRRHIAQLQQKYPPMWGHHDGHPDWHH